MGNIRDLLTRVFTVVCILVISALICTTIFAAEGAGVVKKGINPDIMKNMLAEVSERNYVRSQNLAEFDCEVPRKFAVVDTVAGKKGKTYR